jgi:hypothetical protein
MGEELGPSAPRADARAALLALAARRIDAVLPDRALLYGSALPDARDLDLVVSEAGAQAAGSALAAAGFARRGSTWARFDGCAVGVVELLPAATLRVPPPLLDAAFAGAEVLPGLRRIVVPAPRHDLLLLARRLRRAQRLEPKHRRRIERALHADPDGWNAASAEADPCSAADLARLRRLAGGERVSRPLLRAVRLRPPHVLAVCSLDRACAELHARMLADAADSLGYAGEVVLPGRGTELRAWAAVLRRLGSGGAVVVAAAAPRSPRLAPPALVEFVLSSNGRDRDRVRLVDIQLPTATACEQIAAAAWERLAAGGRLRSWWRRARGRVRRR